MGMNRTHDSAAFISRPCGLAGYPRRYAASIVLREKRKTESL